MRPWSEGQRTIAEINAKKLDIAITALSAIGICKDCGRHCAELADKAMREMGKMNMRESTDEVAD